MNNPKIVNQISETSTLSSLSPNYADESTALSIPSLSPNYADESTALSLPFLSTNQADESSSILSPINYAAPELDDLSSSASPLLFLSTNPEDELLPFDSSPQSSSTWEVDQFSPIMSPLPITKQAAYFNAIKEIKAQMVEKWELIKEKKDLSAKQLEDLKIIQAKINASHVKIKQLENELAAEQKQKEDLVNNEHLPLLADAALNQEIANDKKRPAATTNPNNVKKTRLSTLKN